MAVFDDPKKELQRLQEQLLAEEEYDTQPEFDEDAWLDEALAEAKVLSGYQESTQPVRNYANGYGTQSRSPYQRPAAQNSSPNGQPQRSYLSGYSTYQESRPDYRGEARVYDEELPEEEKGLGGLVALACCLTAGIVAVAMYWVFVLL